MKTKITLNLKASPNTKLRMRTSTKVIIVATSLSFILFLVGGIFFLNVTEVRNVLGASKATSQSDIEQMLDKCTSQTGDNIFLKAYRIKLKQGENNKSKKATYSYLFTCGKKYMISGCSGNNKNNLILELYNPVRLIASTYDPKSKMNLHGIEFTCMKTGMYNLNFYFENGEEGYGVAVLSFKQM